MIFVLLIRFNCQAKCFQFTAGVFNRLRGNSSFVPHRQWLKDYGPKKFLFFFLARRFFGPQVFEDDGLIGHLWWQLKLNIRLSSSEILGGSPLITTDEVIGRKLEPFHLPIPKQESKQSLFLNALKAEKANGWQSFVFENRR